jgi:hypothetical protein
MTASYYWLAAAGAAAGLGLYAHVSFLPVVVVLPLAGLILWLRGGPGNAGVELDGVGLAVLLAAFLVVAAPLVVDAALDPGTVRARVEQDWDGDGRRERAGDLARVARGYGTTLESLVWRGSEVRELNLPGRPWLDPLLALAALAGVALALRHPLAPLHAVALLWLAGFLLPAALVAPGNPALLQPLLPVLVLFPLLGPRALLDLARRRGRLAARLAGAAAVLVAGAGWSLVDYAARWAPADATERAYRGDVRDAIATAEELLASGSPVYLGMRPEDRPLLDYLAPDSAGRPGSVPAGPVLHTVDTRTTLVVPAAGGGYLVYPASSAPPAELAALLGPRPVATGRDLGGQPAYAVWRAGEELRGRLPATVPTIRFPDGFALVGFAIRPDLGDVATTGQLPDPPRVAVTLVWDVPRGAPPHLARVRLVPSDPALAGRDQLVESGETWLTAGPPLAAGNRGRELIVTRLSVPVPEGADPVIDVQAGLLSAGGELLPPLGPPSVIVGDYAFLNRVQYVRDSSRTP